MSTVELDIITCLNVNDKRGISLIYDKWADSLYGIICQICNDDFLAEEVLQDVILSVWSNRHSYDPSKAKLFTWIYRIARNKAIDARRKAERVNISSIDQNGELVSAENSSSLVERSELNMNIGKLDPKYKEVLNAVFYQGLSQKACSDALGIPLGTVKSRLRIALRELQKVYHKLPISLILILLVHG